MLSGSRLALAALLAVTAAAATARAQGLRRFAIVAGNDSGGGDTRALLYASADARKVHEILTRLGGVRPEDATLLVGASASQLLSAIVAVEMQAAEAKQRGERTALFFYYSGHAKDGSLRLGETRIPVEGLKARIAASPVDVRIAIFDSCKSGATTTRTKGARKAPAFEIQADGPRDAKGVVILTSSTSDEDSQESDAIGGSYFSHHLASGLLGGADKSGDGRVTLFEAYAYAYDRTVADTAESAAGAQHPTFSYDLAGNGDLVLTDVAVRHEGVYLPREAPSGVYFLVDGKGFVAAEISKADGADRRVALAPGHYRVKRRLPDRLRVGEIDVPRGQMVALAETRLRDAPFSDDPVKGAGRVDLTSRWSLGAGATYQSVFAAPSGASLFPPTGMLAVDLSLRNFLRKDWVWSLDVAAGSTDSVVATVG
ncbi:MAG TPA: caspase family protein, partial [Polyangia bacterium]|nr:caspase family protein [Polyangia bacterium]